MSLYPQRLLLILRGPEFQMSLHLSKYLGLMEDVENNRHPSAFKVNGMTGEVAEHYVVTELEIFRLLAAGDDLTSGRSTLASLGNSN